MLRIALRETRLTLLGTPRIAGFEPPFKPWFLRHSEIFPDPEEPGPGATDKRHINTWIFWKVLCPLKPAATGRSAGYCRRSRKGLNPAAETSDTQADVRRP